MSPILGVVASSKPKTIQAYESIATYTGAGNPGTITFSGIPSTYKHLQLRLSTKSLGSNAANSWYKWHVNGVNTGGQYSEGNLSGNGSTLTAYTSAITGNNFESMFNPGSDTDAGVYGIYIIDFYDYANTSRWKAVNSYSGTMANTNTTRLGLTQVGGSFNSTAAISSISLVSVYGAWATGSKFALYGIKG